MPPLLRLPNVIFEPMLGRTMKIDPEARSSMWEDLKHGRRTEIDYLQGVVTEIAERRGLEAPLSRRIVELIRQAEREARGSPGLTATPSPGYDARLQEQRAAQRWDVEPALKPVPKPRGKKAPAH